MKPCQGLELIHEDALGKQEVPIPWHPVAAGGVGMLLEGRMQAESLHERPRNGGFDSCSARTVRSALAPFLGLSAPLFFSPPDTWLFIEGASPHFFEKRVLQTDPFESLEQAFKFFITETSYPVQKTTLLPSDLQTLDRVILDPVMMVADSEAPRQVRPVLDETRI